MTRVLIIWSILTALALNSLNAHAAEGAQTAGIFPFNPSLPVTGGGPVFNCFSGDDQAVTNAAAHIGFGLAIPLLGEHFWGKKGKWIAGLGWIGLTLVHESLFHAPKGPTSPGYPSEVRTDLATSIVPTLFVLAF